MFYDRLKSRLEQNGYLITDSLINALEYGVPQSRERAIAIGFRSDLVPAKSSHELNSQFSWDRNKLFLIDKIMSYPWSRTDPFGENLSLDCPVGIPVNLTVEHWFKKTM